MTNVVLSVVMLAGGALGYGAYVAFRRGDRQRGWLMAIAALVMIVNVGIWTLPTNDGDAPAAIVAR